ncbi:hypothetical protein M404DRAFT_1007783 [Pisolithus tinctorius Marx 270]|uniref:Uncharacterized protein n=1 Tax=Pisolithus tinctorius Marx 270 TaxID=870435 RepID=A0A0C3NH75_PISTI|nr:hypothetical protein M404DRAFT_1007783 [Pisolithus tinctorius Marx 270]
MAISNGSPLLCIQSTWSLLCKILSESTDYDNRRRRHLVCDFSLHPFHSGLSRSSET